MVKSKREYNSLRAEKGVAICFRLPLPPTVDAGFLTMEGRLRGRVANLGGRAVVASAEERTRVPLRG